MPRRTAALGALGRDRADAPQRGETRKRDNSQLAARRMQGRHIPPLGEAAQGDGLVGRERGLQGKLQELPDGARREVGDTAAMRRIGYV